MAFSPAILVVLAPLRLEIGMVLGGGYAILLFANEVGPCIRVLDVRE